MKIKFEGDWKGVGSFGNDERFLALIFQVNQEIELI